MSGIPSSKQSSPEKGGEDYPSALLGILSDRQTIQVRRRAERIPEWRSVWSVKILASLLSCNTGESSLYYSLDYEHCMYRFLAYYLLQHVPMHRH
jgi:hypothetical protein